MAAPLRTGRALATQRLVGLVFLAVLTALVGLSIAVYQKAFTPVITVTLQADRVGSQLTKGADVKARGLIVGEVRDVASNGTQATLTLALNTDNAAQLPSDLQARMIPKTLFGEKIVDLILDDTSTARPLRTGDVITQDRTETARETAEALDNLLPLLQTLKPAQVSTTLNAVSSALRGRGDQIGTNLVLVDDYLTALNPDLPALQNNLTGVADLADTLTSNTPQISTLLDNLTFLSRSLTDQEDQLRTFLTSTTTSTDELTTLLTDNQTRLIRLAADSLPSLQVYDRYSPGTNCLLRGLVAQEKTAGDAFGGFQPGLHITLELVGDQGSYIPGDEPRYGEDAGPTCTGLPPNAPIRPFPVDVEVTDGYCDEEEEASPGITNGCRGNQSPVPAADPARALSRSDQDRRAVGAAVAPVLGLTPDEVPDLAVLLFGPMARGTLVGVSN